MTLFAKLFGKKTSSDNSCEKTATEECTSASTLADKKAIKNANTLKFEALEALRIGQTEFALKALRESLRLHATFETRYYLAELLLKGGHYQEALEHYNILVAEAPEHPYVRLYRAEVCYNLDTYSEAIDDLNKALALLKEEDEELRPMLYSLLANTYVAQKDWQPALEAAQQAITLTDKDPKAHLLQIKSLIALSWVDKASEAIDKAVVLFPEEERLHLYEAEIALQKEDYTAALLAYQKTLDKDPFNTDAHCGSARLLIQQGKESEAQTLLQEAIEEGIVSAPMLDLLLQILPAEEQAPYQKLLEEVKLQEGGDTTLSPSPVANMAHISIY